MFFPFNFWHLLSAAWSTDKLRLFIWLGKLLIVFIAFTLPGGLIFFSFGRVTAMPMLPLLCWTLIGMTTSLSTILILKAQSDARENGIQTKASSFKKARQKNNIKMREIEYTCPCDLNFPD